MGVINVDFCRLLLNDSFLTKWTSKIALFLHESNPHFPSMGSHAARQARGPSAAASQARGPKMLIFHSSFKQISPYFDRKLFRGLKRVLYGPDFFRIFPDFHIFDT